MPGVSGEINLNDPFPDLARERYDAANKSCFYRPRLNAQ
jgi:hypothetical protein